MTLSDLKKIASGATPGPRGVVANAPFYAIVEKPAPSLSKHDDDAPTYWRYEDGVFHAALHPEVALALVEVAEKARIASAELKRQSRMLPGEIDDMDDAIARLGVVLGEKK